MVENFKTLKSWAPSTAATYEDTGSICATPQGRVGSALWDQTSAAFSPTSLDKTAKAWIPFIASAAACGNVYYRSDYSKGYSYYGAFEVWFFKHFVFEADKSNPQAWWAAFTRRDWDDGIIVCPVGCRGTATALEPSYHGRGCPTGC